MGMGWYIIRRIGWAAIASYIIVSITWGMLAAAPNQQVQSAQMQAVQQGKSAEEAAERARQIRGLDKPLWVRYKNYMVNVYTLQWGWSESRSQPVWEAVKTSLYYTAQYSVPWTLLTVLIGPAVGLYSAANKYSWKDHLGTFFAFWGFAIPNFWFGIILILVFGVYLGWVPVVYQTDVGVFTWANVKQLILPVFVLTTGSIGGIMRVSRNESSEYMNADFAKTARAKGTSSTRIMTRHILRPAAVPMSTTLVGQMLALFIGSSYLVEIVFGIPGLGQLTFAALQSQDTALLLGTSFVAVFIAVISNLLQDITYTVLDPRIDFGDR